MQAAGFEELHEMVMGTFDDSIVREGFSEWINIVAEEVKDEIVAGNPKRRYYVYALCEKKIDGTLIPFYFGKGAKDRVWGHSDETEKEKEEIIEEAKELGLSEEELRLRLDDVSAKHHMINEIGEDHLAKIIIKTGLTEYEALMCESALINIFKLDGLKFSDKDKLTNIINGHSNPFEKHAEVKTEALPVEEYHKRYCKKPIVVNAMTKEQISDLKGKKIMLQNINSSYKECNDSDLFPTEERRNEAIREAVCGFWDHGDPESMDYVFAMYQGKIKGVYKVSHRYSKRTGEKVFYRFFDLWREGIDYPRFDKLTGRKKDYEFSKSVYDDLIASGVIDKEHPDVDLPAKTRKTLYYYLSPETQKLVEEYYSDSQYKEWLANQRKKDPKYPDDKTSREMFYNLKLRSSSIKKYYVLEDITEETDPGFLKYINCSVKVKRDGGYESVFAGKVCLGKDGKQYRAKGRYMVYLDEVIKCDKDSSVN